VLEKQLSVVKASVEPVPAAPALDEPVEMAAEVK